MPQAGGDTWRRAGDYLQSFEEEQGGETRHVSDWVGNTSPSSLANSTPPTEGLELPCTICCPVLGVYPGFRHRPQICAKKKKPNITQTFHHRGTDLCSYGSGRNERWGGHETLRKWARQLDFRKQQRVSWDRFVSTLGSQLSSYYGWAPEPTDGCH